MVCQSFEVLHDGGEMELVLGAGEPSQAHSLEAAMRPALLFCDLIRSRPSVRALDPAIYQKPLITMRLAE